jgi:hypothetical protein
MDWIFVFDAVFAIGAFLSAFALLYGGYLSCGQAIESIKPVHVADREASPQGRSAPQV